MRGCCLEEGSDGKAQMCVGRVVKDGKGKYNSVSLCVVIVQPRIIALLSLDQEVRACVSRQKLPEDTNLQLHTPTVNIG